VTRRLELVREQLDDAEKEQAELNQQRDEYQNLFNVTLKTQPFRAPQITKWPRIAGLLTATVTGPSGEEIYTDKYGRIKVQFHWDRVQKKDENSLHGRRLLFIRQMAEAIEYVHKQGFIHRDVCPRNFICFADLSGLKLIDFGLTVPATKEFMKPGNRTGTPLFMAPEIVRRRATDQRVDVFAFGVTAFNLCTFDFPWPSTDTTGRAALYHDTSPPTDILKLCPDMHPGLAKAIMGCMQADLSKRTPTMTQFLAQINGIESEFNPSVVG
jgi:serine/threonine protein kinase